MNKLSSIALLVFLISCRNEWAESSRDQYKIAADTAIEVIKPPLVVAENKLLGTWKSVLKSSNGIETDYRDTHTITFNMNQRFKSFCKPTNHKTGSWRIHNGNDIRLYMKATDTYRVLAMTDSSLTTHLLFVKPDSTVIHYQKMR